MELLKYLIKEAESWDDIQKAENAINEANLSTKDYCNLMMELTDKVLDKVNKFRCSLNNTPPQVLHKNDVFDSKKSLLGCTFRRCAGVAAARNYKYLSFNGIVYKTIDGEMLNPICKEEDLLDKISVDVNNPDTFPPNLIVYFLVKRIEIKNGQSITAIIAAKSVDIQKI